MARYARIAVPTWRHRAWRLMLTVVALTGVIYLSAAGFLAWRQEVFLFPRHLVAAARIGSVAEASRTVWTAPDGTPLAGLVMAGSDPAGPVFLLFGGNAHDVAGFVEQVFEDVFAGQVTVSGFNYRGYAGAAGTSGGAPTQAALVDDAVFLFDTMAERHPGRPIVAVGYSLGGGVAVQLASRRPVAALGLVAPFTSIRDLAARQYPIFPIDLLLRHPFRSDALISEIEVPVHLFVAGNDGLIPPSHPERLRPLLRQPAQDVTFAGARHGSILDAPGFVPALRAIVPE